MSCLVNVMIRSGATIPEVQQVIAADELLVAGESGPAEMDAAEAVLDAAARKYIGQEDDRRSA